MENGLLDYIWYLRKIDERFENGVQVARVDKAEG